MLYIFEDGNYTVDVYIVGPLDQMQVDKCKAGRLSCRISSFFVWF